MTGERMAHEFPETVTGGNSAGDPIVFRGRSSEVERQLPKLSAIDAERLAR
jgi:hypothetical protein